MSNIIINTGKSQVTPIHPGQYIRNIILTPKKLSVIDAAKLVGVGRPAFSNFLNGNVTTTTEMASRIEIAFGVPVQHLLDMQVAYDASQAKVKNLPANVMPYVAPFLGIKANDIVRWADHNISARTKLSVLLRTLVNSTGSGLTKVDFPGNDDAERPGWDGHIDSTQPTPWIPEGLSGWEFGTNQDIKGKADSDFAKSVKASAKEEVAQTTFVFVTPRSWPSKDKWITENKAKGIWKDVRAYDSSDLEQWLEQSISAQTWFANETECPSDGVRTLDKCWTDWANVAEPQLVGSLFGPTIEGAKRNILSCLSQQPFEPIIITADSTDEALAFLSQFFGPLGGEEPAKFRDKVLVFNKPGLLPKLAQGSKNFIAIACDREVERELGPFSRLMQTIVVYPRNAANVTPHVVLEPLNYEAFRISLEEMSYERDDITKFSNESGRSLTVLRRRLANVPAVQTPAWAANHETSVNLIPFLFVGAWSSTNKSDQAAFTILCDGNNYEQLEKKCQHLAALNDAPLWSVGTYRGVISKIDLLFSIASCITTQDLERYFSLAKIVLGEDDPKLDLPEDERWTAIYHGKSREFSNAMRKGISETLVLLAVYGNNLFKSRLGFDCEYAATNLVEELLTPLKSRILEANDQDLTAYAEAAPSKFLSILEEDLNKETPETYQLLRPVENSIFGGGCARSGLLWALEGLAWSPVTLPRSASILAQLAEIKIDDNWANKPINSLESIFRMWMPQTAANHETRLSILKRLADKFPNVTWKICVSQLNTGHSVGHYSHKPNWRNDAQGHGEPLKSNGPVLAFMKDIIDMILDWKGDYSIEMLCDLIQHLHDLAEEHQTKVWGLLNSWAKTSSSDKDKAFVREQIRITVMSRRGMNRSKKANFAVISAAAKVTFKSLEPTNLLNKHEWLFRQQWVDDSADELHDDGMDFSKREERIAKLRTEALRGILKVHGVTGIIEFAEMGKAANQIGWHMTHDLLLEDDIPAFLSAALPAISDNSSWTKKNLIAGATRALQDKVKRINVLNKLKKSLSDSDFLRLLLLAPFERSTWLIVDELGGKHLETYWSEINPGWVYDADDENNEAVKHLIDAKRPRAAFACVHFKLNIIEPQLLFKLMSDMARNEGIDKPSEYQLDQYYIEEAFELMDKNPELTLEQKAGLEFTYIEVLARPWDKGYGIPNIEKYIEDHPEFFVQAIVWTYKRRGEGEDPAEFRVDPNQVENFANKGYKLLDALNRVPGYELGELKVNKLAQWIKKVREAAADLGRIEIADTCIGKLLSCAPIGGDGVWPCEPVRQVMEDVHSKDIMNGAHTGLYNSRGVVMRAEGGGQERELANKYLNWANALQYSHPFLASELLMGMVKTYEHEADREDIEAGINKRLR